VKIWPPTDVGGWPSPRPYVAPAQPLPRNCPVIAPPLPCNCQALALSLPRPWPAPALSLPRPWYWCPRIGLPLPALSFRALARPLRGPGGSWQVLAGPSGPSGTTTLLLLYTTHTHIIIIIGLRPFGLRPLRPSASVWQEKVFDEECLLWDDWMCRRLFWGGDVPKARLIFFFWRKALRVFCRLL